MGRECLVEISSGIQAEDAELLAPFHLDDWSLTDVWITAGESADLERIASRVATEGPAWNRTVRRLGSALKRMVASAPSDKGDLEHRCATEEEILAFVLDELSPDRDEVVAGQLGAGCARCVDALLSIDYAVEAIVRARAFFFHLGAQCDECADVIEGTARSAELMVALARAARLPVEPADCPDDGRIVRFAVCAIDTTIAAVLSLHIAACARCGQRFSSIADHAQEAIRSWTRESGHRAQADIETLLRSDVEIGAIRIGAIRDDGPPGDSPIRRIERMLAAAGHEVRRITAEGGHLAVGDWTFASWIDHRIYVSVGEEIVASRGGLALEVVSTDGILSHRTPIISSRPARFAIDVDALNAVGATGGTLRIVIPGLDDSAA